MITIEKQGNRIILLGGPVPGVRTIPGAYHSDRKDAWTFPLTLETCRILRQKLGDKLTIGPDLKRWAKAEVQHREDMHTLSNSNGAKLYRTNAVAPALVSAMESRPYQAVAARFIADARRVLVADEQGLGKTLEIIAGVLESRVPGPYLVVCPKSAVHAVWRREIERWLPAHRAHTLPDGWEARNESLNGFEFLSHDPHVPGRWLIVNPDVCLAPKFWRCRKCGDLTPYKRNLHWLNCGHDRKTYANQYDEPKHPQLFEIEWGAVIVDECHDSLIRRSGVPTQRRNGLDMLDVRADGLKIAASGTPMRDKPEQLWGSLNWADKKRFSSYWNFVKSYWETGGYTGWQIGSLMPEREEMLWDSLKPVVIRRTKSEVAPDLPAKTYVGTPLADTENAPQVVVLPMDGKQAKAYQSMVKDTVAQMRRGRMEALTPIAELTRKRQLAASYGSFVNDRFRAGLPSNKFEYLLQLLEQLGFPNQPVTKVLVFSNQNRLLAMVNRELNRIYKRKITTAITGKTKNEVRGKRIERFNNDDSALVMLLNIKAGGSAITIDSADHSVFMDRSHLADQESQAEDRTHRVSKPRKVFYHYLVSEGTIDVGMSLLNAEKAGKTARLLDTRRAVEYAKRALALSE